MDSNKPSYDPARVEAAKPGGPPALMTLEELRNGNTSFSFTEQQEALELAAQMDSPNLSDFLSSTTTQGLRELINAAQAVAIQHRLRAEHANDLEQHIRNYAHSVATYGLEEVVAPTRAGRE